MFRINEIKQSR